MASKAAKRGFAPLIIVRVATLPDLRPSREADHPTKEEKPMRANHLTCLLKLSSINLQSFRTEKKRAIKENLIALFYILLIRVIKRVL